MIEELRQVLEQIEQQPDDVQRRIAELLRLQLEEQEWDALIGSPEGQQVLDQLAAEAREEIARGEVEDGGWG